MLRLCGHRSWLSGLAGRRPARSRTVVAARARGQIEQSLLIFSGVVVTHLPVSGQTPVPVQARNRGRGRTEFVFLLVWKVARVARPRAGEERRTRPSSSRLITPVLLKAFWRWLPTASTDRKARRRSCGSCRSE